MTNDEWVGGEAAYEEMLMWRRLKRKAVKATIAFSMGFITAYLLLTFT